MAPPRLYRQPYEQLIESLAESRRMGLRFEEAWACAIRPGKPLILANAPNPPNGAVRWPTDSSDRIAWQEAFKGIKDDLRRAYDRRPSTARERAVVHLARVLTPDAAGGMATAAAVRSVA